MSAPGIYRPLYNVGFALLSAEHREPTLLKFSNPLIMEIMMRVHFFLSDGRNIVFLWLPSHVGLAGNVAVDAAAKAALALDPHTIRHTVFGFQTGN
jgi:hypothetical protein